MTDDCIRIFEQMLRMAALLHRTHHRMHMERRGMHHGQGRLLAALSRMDGASQKDLVEKMGIRAPSLTELVGKLETAGLIERRQNEEDKRVMHIHLTESGKEMAETSDKARSELVGQMFTFLDEGERKQLSELFDKLIRGMEQFTENVDEIAPHPHGPGHGGMGRHRHHPHPHHPHPHHTHGLDEMELPDDEDHDHSPHMGEHGGEHRHHHAVPPSPHEYDHDTDVAGADGEGGHPPHQKRPGEGRRHHPAHRFHGRPH